MVNKLQRIKESIERRVAEWHNSDCPLTLVEFLGWTPKEYVEWLEEQIVPERERNTLS